MFLFCSYVSASFFFSQTFLGRIQDLFPYLFLDLFFLYFFSRVEDRKVHVLPSTPQGSGAQFFREERGRTLLRSHGEPPTVTSSCPPNWKTSGAPDFVTGDTGKKPGSFLFIRVQKEKGKNESPRIPEAVRPRARLPLRPTLPPAGQRSDQDVTRQ